MSTKKPETSRKRAVRTAEQCQRHREATIRRLLDARAEREPEPYVEEPRTCKDGTVFMVLVRQHVDCGS
jgi:hypothetical protein